MAAQFSAFSSVALRFSSAPPAAEVIYESLRDSFSGKFSGDWDTNAQIRFYAMAKCLGAAKDQITQAGQENDPSKTQRLLSALEKDYLLTVSPNDTIDDRRDALSAAFSVKRGNTSDAIRTGLRALLGDNFLGLRSMEINPSTVSTPIAIAGLFPYGNPWPWKNGISADIDPYAPSTVTTKFVRLTSQIINTGTQSFIFELLGGSSALENGEKLTLVASPTRYETVIVSCNDSKTSYFAPFTMTHEAGEYGTTASVPVMGSYMCFLLVGVAESVIQNPTLSARVNLFLERVSQCTMSWALTSETGPFKCGDGLGNGGRLNITPIGFGEFS